MLTEKKLKELQASGKIKGFEVYLKIKTPGKIQCSQKSKGSKQKAWMHWNLLYWANKQAAIVQTEYQFDKDRKWRFDFAIPKLMIAVEYEGIMSNKSGHTTITGYTDNTEKYNAAAAQGWKLFRFTARNYKSMMRELDKCL